MLILEDLTPAEYTLIVNGCGAKGLRMPDFGVFGRACAVHDLDYWVGGSDIDRLIADWRFYGSMRYALRRLSWWRRAYLRVVAWVYYRAVRGAGGAAFHHTKRPRGRVDLDALLEAGER